MWSASDWLRAAGPAVRDWYSLAPGFLADVTECGWLISCSEPDPDDNWLAIHCGGADGRTLIRRGVKAFRELGRPFTICLAADHARDLRDQASDSGCEFAGPLPHYAIETANIARLHSVEGESIDTISDDAGFLSFLQVLAAAFDPPTDFAHRLFHPSLLKIQAFHLYGFRYQDDLVSAALIWRGDRIAYLTVMATDPRFQVRGFGFRLMHHVIAAEREAGIEHIHLVASPAGERLYRKIGFVLVAEHQLWTRGVF